MEAPFIPRIGSRPRDLSRLGGRRRVPAVESHGTHPVGDSIRATARVSPDAPVRARASPSPWVGKAGFRAVKSSKPRLTEPRRPSPARPGWQRRSCAGSLSAEIPSRTANHCLRAPTCVGIPKQPADQIVCELVVYEHAETAVVAERRDLEAHAVRADATLCPPQFPIPSVSAAPGRRPPRRR